MLLAEKWGFKNKTIQSKALSDSLWIMIKAIIAKKKVVTNKVSPIQGKKIRLSYLIYFVYLIFKYKKP